MAYERMTLSSFSEHLKAGKYETATGARRAVGKATDWSAHDKDLAANAINAHFGEDGGKATTARTAKKTVKVAKKTTKKTAAKVAAKTAPVVAKKAVKAAPVKRAVSRRAPTMKAAEATATAAEPLDTSFMLPVRTVTPALIGEAVLRQNNASNIVVALAALQSRDALEQRVYTKALASAEQSFDTASTAAAPKPFVSLREQTAANPEPTIGTRPSEKAIEAVRLTAQALANLPNSVPAQPLG